MIVSLPYINPIALTLSDNVIDTNVNPRKSPETGDLKGLPSPCSFPPSLGPVGTGYYKALPAEKVCPSDITSAGLSVSTEFASAVCHPG